MRLAGGQEARRHVSIVALHFFFFCLQSCEINPRLSRRERKSGRQAERRKEETKHKQRPAQPAQGRRGWKKGDRVPTTVQHANTWQSRGCAEAERKPNHLYALEWQLSLAMSNNRRG